MTFANNNRIFKRRNDVIDFIEDFGSMIHKA